MGEVEDLRHLLATVFMAELATFMVVPAMTDVTMSALCPGVDQCSLAIYLSGFQQAIIGLGSIVITPVMGSLSDHYGRKAVLTIPLAISVIPLGILGYSRETNFFYAYYVVKTIVAMVSDGTINCLALAYVADNIAEEGRASAFGVLSGIIMASFVFGTLLTRFLSTPLTFQVATVMSMVAAMYMRVFLKDKADDSNIDLTQPILKTSQNDDTTTDLIQPTTISNKIVRIGDVIGLLRNSVTFTQLAVVAFFQGLSDGGLQSAAMFYWKARFHFTKNQYADLFLLVGAAGMLSQLILMPLLARRIREEKLLSLGLSMGFMNMLVCSIAWSIWVPYVATALIVFVALSQPSLRCIVSKQIGPNEQGKAQGCISSISSAGNIFSPLIFSPLTALFLSEEAPFGFPGFSMLCIGFASMIAFVQSVMIKGGGDSSSKRISSTPEDNSNNMEVP